MPTPWPKQDETCGTWKLYRRPNSTATTKRRRLPYQFNAPNRNDRLVFQGQEEVESVWLYNDGGYKTSVFCRGNESLALDEKSKARTKASHANGGGYRQNVFSRGHDLFLTFDEKSSARNDCCKRCRLQTKCFQSRS